MEVIFCGGNNTTFTDIAIKSGFLYGARLPSSVTHSLYFADQNFKSPDRKKYIAALKTHTPHMATVIDWTKDVSLSTVMNWAEEASQYVNEVILIPKVNFNNQIPRTINSKLVRLGFSVPTNYGKTELSPEAFKGWPIHLLGGSPASQLSYYKEFSRFVDTEVISIDMNMHMLMANRFCAFWSPIKGKKGHWVSLSEVGDGNWGKDSNKEAFTRSCINIMELWHTYR